MYEKKYKLLNSCLHHHIRHSMYSIIKMCEESRNAIEFNLSPNPMQMRTSLIELQFPQ
eukprot:c36983_g1_i1 orf=151-324(+)